MQPKNTKINLLVLLFFSLITVIITWPLLLHLNTLIIDPYDSLLINWIINWSLHHPFDFNTTIFFPFKNTLAYSDFHVVSALTAAPFVFWFKEPLLAFNINFLLGFILTGFSTYLLTNLLTKDSKIALVAGTLFTFGAIHLNYYVHLQLFGFWPFVFTLYFFFRKSWLAFVLLFFLSVATMPLFLFFFMFVFGIFYAVFRTNLKPILVACGLSSLVLIPYYLVSKEFNYVRPITDTIHFSLTFPQFFKSTDLLTLVLIPVVLFKIVNQTKTTKLIIAFLVLCAVSFILSFGPALHIFEDTIHVGPLPAIPLPYLIFYYLVPGFSGFRTPSRWLLLAFFAFVILFALAFKHKVSKTITVLLLLIILLLVPAPFTYFKIPARDDFPPEQVWLEKNRPGDSLIQFPIYGWFDGTKIAVETLRMHYSIYQDHPMYNGFSGFSPKSWEQDVQWLQKDFPSQKTLSYLNSKGIKLVLVPPSWRQKMLKFSQLTLLASFPQADIYALNSSSHQ